jgi:hypothetical protein
MSKILIGAGALAFGAVVAMTLADVRRYLKIRSM